MAQRIRPKKKDKVTIYDVAREAGVPMTNYGVLLACVHGILDRALEPFPLAKMIWEERNK